MKCSGNTTGLGTVEDLTRVTVTGETGHLLPSNVASKGNSIAFLIGRSSRAAEVVVIRLAAVGARAEVTVARVAVTAMALSVLTTMFPPPTEQRRGWRWGQRRWQG